VQIVVRRTSERLHALETRGRSGDRGSGPTRDVPEDARQRASVLQDMRRSRYDEPPAVRTCRCLRSLDSNLAVHSGGTRQLFGNSASDEGWVAEVQGLPEGIRRIGRAGF